MTEETGLRADQRLIFDIVSSGARVLDVGCGDGVLLDHLARAKGVDARGIELSREGVASCVAKGLAVIQGDADTDLTDYPDDCFDTVILSQTLQATRRPRHVLEQMLRIGRNAIVSFPNFGHWRIRTHLLLHGRMPVTENLPDSWYDTPNIHFCTIRDFVALAGEVNAEIVRAEALDATGRPMGVKMPWWFWNLMGEQGVFLLARR
ncbi:MAG: methionine biosynthesis protein MetW [Proteobacteria bacterium]|nr:methionine biosynthesis protein MetW [Pseudomonadota bacterium]